MFMKKTILLLLAGFAFMQNLSAQDYVDSSSDIYGLGETNYQKKWVRTLSVSVLKQAEVGFNVRRNYGRYFAWDVYGLSYGYDFFGKRTFEEELTYKKEIDINHEITWARTGIRLFSPQWGSFKFYASAGAGAEALIYDKINTTLGRYEYRWVQTSLYGGYNEYVWVDDGTEVRNKNKATPALRVDVQAGFYIGERISIGYQGNFHLLCDDKGRAEHNEHMVRLAIDF